MSVLSESDDIDIKSLWLLFIAAIFRLKRFYIHNNQLLVSCVDNNNDDDNGVDDDAATTRL